MSNAGERQKTLRLKLRVQPGAARERVVGWLGGALKLSVNAAPEKGKANQAVERLLANALGLPSAAVSVVSGHASRNKVAEIEGLTKEEIAARLGLKGNP